MTSPQLSIVIPTRDDPGLWATVNDLWRTHRDLMPETEIVIVDNSAADSPTADALAKHCRTARNVRFLSYRGSPVSSCLYKEAGIRESRAPVVLCIDSHVLLPAGVLSTLLAWFSVNQASRDLLTGPVYSRAWQTQPDATNQMLYDSEPYPLPTGAVTHHGVVCRGEQLGAWVRDPRWAESEPFEVQQHGTGFFAFRRDAWPGFHPAAFGFGGNETPLMHAIRQQGGRVLCHPGLPWIHNFADDSRHNYPKPRWEKIRNYLAAFTAQAADQLYNATLDYFRSIDPESVERALQSVPAALEAKFDLSPRPAATHKQAATPRFDEIMPIWKAAGGDVGGSCPAPLYEWICRLRPKRPDVNPPRPTRTLEFGCGLSTLGFDRQGTDHTAIEHDAEWAARTERHLQGDGVRIVRAPLVARDGVTWYDWQPPDGALYDVILIDGPPGHTPGKTPGRDGCYDVVVDHLAPGGVVVVDDTHRPAEAELSQRIADKLGLTRHHRQHGQRAFDLLVPPTQPLGEGPGTELKRDFSDAGFPACQQCEYLARRMNGWGPAGCRERLAEIVADILPRAKAWSAKRAVYLPRWIPGVETMEESALRLAIQHKVLRAIEQAEASRD